jgi:hypothetical protein
VSRGRTRSAGIGVASTATLLPVGTRPGCVCRAADIAAEVTDLPLSAEAFEAFEDKASATRAWFVALISPSEMPTAICVSSCFPDHSSTLMEAQPRGGGVVKMPLTYARVNLWKTREVP